METSIYVLSGGFHGVRLPRLGVGPMGDFVFVGYEQEEPAIYRTTPNERFLARLSISSQLLRVVDKKPG